MDRRSTQSTACGCLRLISTISFSPLPVCLRLTSLRSLKMLAGMLADPSLLIMGSKVLTEVDLLE
ncbi:unnamed protein product [Prunus armeniaca]